MKNPTPAPDILHNYTPKFTRIKYCTRCSNTKLKGKCIRCGRIRK